MRLVVFTILICMGFSCQKEADPLRVESEENLASVEPSLTNAYSQSKTVNGYTIAVTYQPNNTVDAFDSDRENLNNQSLHFLMEIETDGEHRTGNFLYHDAYDASDFKANVNYFNFEIVNDVSVAVNGQPYQVVLSNMENTYTLDDKRKIHFVAVPLANSLQQEQFQKINFVYDDTVLGVGKTKFTFQTEEIKPISNKIEH